jgi:hypothetical protein
MSKSKVNGSVSRKDHLRGKVIKALEYLGTKPHSLDDVKIEKEYKQICRLVIEDRVLTKEYSGLYARVLQLARDMGASNV